MDVLLRGVLWQGGFFCSFARKKFSVICIPELRTNVAAGSACNIHLVLVAISAVWAFPNELSAIFDNLNFAVIAADLAIIRLGIQLCVHDIFIDELNKIGRAHV